VLVLGAATIGVVDLLDGNPSTATVKPLPLDAGGRPAATRINQIYARVSSSVVSIQVIQSSGAGSGTGFVINADGTIVTNAHVVGDASQVKVRYDDKGDSYDAQVVGTDPSSDLAVLRPSSSSPKRPALPLADSDQVRVGDEAIAIGYPLGLDRTATAGIISGLGREIQAPNGFQIDQVIQTDAPINPGNSGGPLLDARGRVIGINSQIATAGSQGNVGIGFAVPSNTIRKVVPQLEAGKSIRRPYLGVSTSTPLTGAGALVRQVNSGGPAERAGLRAASDPTGRDGDRIVGIDGKAVNGPDDVSNAIENRRPGDTVALEVESGGSRRTVSVTLGERPAQVP
jgi:putative serine protease PepD